MTDEIKSLDDLKAAVGVADEPVVAEPAIVRVAVRDALGRSYATGKRKDAVARVWVKPGSGRVVVNGKEMAAYFARPGDSQDLYGAICKATEDDRGRNLKAQKALDLFKSKYTLEKILPVFMDYYSFMAAGMTKGSKHSNKTLP